MGSCKMLKAVKERVCGCFENRRRRSASIGFSYMHKTLERGSRVAATSLAMGCTDDFIVLTGKDRLQW